MKVKGLVKNAATAAPLAGVKVVLTVGERELAVLFSDKEGRFEYMEEKEYTGQTLKCRVEKEGFKSQEAIYKIDQDEVSPGIELVPEEPVEEKKRTSAPPPPPPPPRPWLKIAIGIAAAIVVAIGIYFVISHEPKPQPIEIQYFKAEPSTIKRGSQSTLSWKTENAVEVTIDEIGEVKPSGSEKVTPQTTTTYTLIAKDKNDERSKTCKVEVRIPEGRSPEEPEGPVSVDCACDITLKQYAGNTLKDFRGRMKFVRQGSEIKSGSIKVRFQSSTLKARIVSGTLAGDKFEIKYANQNQPNRILEAYGNVRFTQNKKFTITNGKYGERNLDWQARCRSN